MNSAAPLHTDSEEAGLLSARGISLAYGGQTILQNLDLNVAAGEIVALLGPVSGLYY
ncbi:hypothetical protein [Alcaligenes aquatilis]|uniref:hypothetical protein n=1 Tax=Alcaligenes aquatilis TaxID=323284 RepID=UPI001F0C1B73|nr:hypothetical protein [Alcaligenes aquatilis]